MMQTLMYTVHHAAHSCILISLTAPTAFQKAPSADISGNAVFVTGIDCVRLHHHPFDLQRRGLQRFVPRASNCQRGLSGRPDGGPSSVRTSLIWHDYELVFTGIGLPRRPSMGMQFLYFLILFQLLVVIVSGAGCISWLKLFGKTAVICFFPNFFSWARRNQLLCAFSEAAAGCNLFLWPGDVCI